MNEIKFDENGYALESGTLETHETDQDNVYIGISKETYVTKGFGLRAGSYLDAPEVEPEINEAIIRKGDKWIIVPDFRNQVFYQKKDGNEVIIDKVGSVPDTLTDKKCPDTWFVFDEKADNWVVDDNLYRQYIENLKQTKQLETAAAAQAYIDAVTQDFAPTFERESYTLQAAEAARWMLDKKASTPILDGIAAARGVDPTALKTKAYEKSQQYQALCAEVTGQRQALEDEINAASTVGALNLIQPSERFKVPS